MAFVKRGAKWPNKAEDYPRHPDWLTLKQAAELLECSVAAVKYQIKTLKTITPVFKRWKYGCHPRAAIFVSKYEVEQVKLRRTVKRKRQSATATYRDDPALLAVNPLRQWRKGEGLSAKEVAERLGVGEAVVGGWEHGRGDPSVERMAGIAALINCDLEELKMRWAAWRILMLAPLPTPDRLPLKLDFSIRPKETDGSDAASEEIS